ncbi:MAG: hypothetical protein J7K39_00700 [Bacteroidales bacterium]|nr:hypothetical protein [Bacteroidales bacterium]
MKKILVLIVLVSIFQVSQAQTIEVSPEKVDLMQRYLAVVKEGRSFYENYIKPCKDKRKREYYNSPEWKTLDKELKELFKTRDEITNRAGKLWGEYCNPPHCKLPYNFPQFNNRADIDKYLISLNNYYSNYPDGPDGNIRKSLVGNCLYEITEELNKNGSKYIGKKITKTETNSNLESEFLAEIAKINSDIAEINSLALNRQIIKSFNKSQILCDKLRRYQGDQYFSRTLKKIRKENPGFSFSITPLAEQVTPEYWMEMRGRANIAYRKAVEAYSGLVWNEGIQTFTANVEIPFRFVKATYDLVTNFKSLFDGKLWGSIDAIRNSYGYQDNAVQLFQTASEEAFNAGEDAKDWKSYIGVAGGLLSAVNGYKQTFDLVRENVTQNGLIKANRETVEQLKKRSKNLLQQFDRYRAYIDSHLSSIDCLNDRIMRLDLDNKSIKGDKITIWGTGLYDWDVDVYVNQIKEAGEYLKNEYIYCEDFIKALQIAYAQAEKNYHTINDKAKSSGAVQYQIDNVLSQNETNYDWFDKEVSRLAEMYTQFCEDENNTYPDDIIIVSNQVIPGVEEQDENPNNPPVWEYEDEEDYEPTYNPEQDELEQNNNINNNNNTSGGNSVPGIISKGNGWSAQKIENNPAAIQNDINNAINSGKTPSGIYISDGHEVLVYYIEGNPLGMTAWKLEDYNDATSLQNGITSNIEQAYFPMGISFTNQGDLYVLFIKSEVSVTAWQLVESQLDLNAVSANMQPYLNQQYVPVGITIYNGMYYTLMTQIPDTKITNWTIEGYQYDNNAIMQNVNTKINSGLIPFGYLKEENIVNILYVGF